MKRFWMVLLTSLFASLGASAAPIGHINHVAYDNGAWTVTGWACEPGSPTVGVGLYVANVYNTGVNTSQTSEQDVNVACGTPGGGTHRFTLTYAGPISGQPIKVVATSGSGSADLVGSNQVGLPDSPHPLAVMSGYSRILIFTAHPDDEILFSPVLGDLCSSRTCKIIVATKGAKGSPGNPEARIQEMANSAAQFPMAHQFWQRLQQPTESGVGLSDAGSEERTVRHVLADWNSDLAQAGQGSLDARIQADVSNFYPDVILTLDPRRGASCHSEHRAVGKAVHAVVAKGLVIFPLERVFFLTTRRDGNTFPLPPNAPYDKNSVVYRASNSFYPGGGVSFPVTGWDFARGLLQYHPSQFGTGSALQGLVNDAGAVPYIDRNTAFQSAVYYDPYDPKHYNCDPIPTAYKLVAYHTANTPSPKCLDVSGGPTAFGNHAGLQQWDCQSPLAGNQIFWDQPTDEVGYSHLQPNHSGRCVDIVNGSGADGAGVQQYACLYPKANAQKFRLQLVMSPDIYEIQTRVSNGAKCLDVQGGPGQFANGAPIQQWQCLGGQNQRWKLVPVSLSPLGDPVP